MADVVADSDGSCWLLTRDAYNDLIQRNPEATIALVSLLAADLGSKLALCGQQLTLLEDL